MTAYELSEEDKEKLREPRGDVLKGDELIKELEKRDYERVIAVGDKVSQDIEASEIELDLSIIDGSIQREKLEDRTENISAERGFKAENPAGKITEEAWKAVRKASSLRCKTKVEITGEEDLMALPAVRFAPEDAVIVYGLWDRGAVLMEASEQNRDFAEDIIGDKASEHLIVGGSWAYLHSGHRYILLTALERGGRIDIGVTSDEMLREKLGEKPEHSFKERREKIEDFLEDMNALDRTKILEINGIYGNAVEEGEKLLVTPETRDNGRKINSKRIELGRDKLDLEVVEKLRGEDGKIISSSRIRAGEIDGNGLKN